MFPVRRPTLIFGPDLKIFYGTYIGENYLDTLFLPLNVVKKS